MEVLQKIEEEENRHGTTEVEIESNTEKERKLKRLSLSQKQE